MWSWRFDGPATFLGCEIMFRLLAVLTLVAVIGCALVSAQDPAAVKWDAYKLCLTATRQTPQSAYEPCKAYLEKYSSDGSRQREFVQNWVAAYEKMQPYVQFLQNLVSEDPKASWLVYEPDLHIEIPQTSQNEGAIQVEISRSFGDANEESMLKKAEAVYSSPSKMIEEVLKHVTYLAQDAPPKEMAPLWGMRGNDSIQETSVLTTRAVRYYYDLAMAAKINPHLPTGFTALHIGLKYDATIKHQDQYSHNKETFTNVYLVDLTLKWSFTCGGLCGMGFTRNKLVVLDNNGNIVAMYLDAPVNSESWVS